MRISPKCSLAIHLLLAVHEFENSGPGGRVTGDILASSAGCNPVVARNILSSLKKAGLINIRRGSGGATMAMNPDEITVWMIYNAVEPITADNFIGMHPHPSLSCPIGWRMREIIAEPYEQILNAMKNEMCSITLQDLLNRYFSISPESGFESAALQRLS